MNKKSCNNETTEITENKENQLDIEYILNNQPIFNEDDFSRQREHLKSVYDIILDETHPYAKNNGYGSLVVGCILYRTKDNVTTSTDKLPMAWPIDKNYKSLPVRNEEVEIYEISEKEFGYRRIQIHLVLETLVI